MNSCVRTDTAGGVGRLVLDRPSALNALDLPMVRALSSALLRWRDDPAVGAVVVASSSPRAFCAGGDIRAVREAVLAGDREAVRAFFTEEYRLNRLIAEYPKPYVALIDGFAMGGGLGISVHGSARVVTERASLAMPETHIGFFPDVGASHFLPRLPGGTGMYLGLTGARIGAGAAVACGLATHFVPSAGLPALERDLARADAREFPRVLDSHARPAPASELADHRERVDHCFGAPALEEVVARLEADGGAWARGALADLRRASPTSLAATFALLRRGARSPLAACLERELRLGEVLTAGPDFAEGVRAVLVDKDGAPAWAPVDTRTAACLQEA
ncbi:enoyl-CoA hydratase/isomerase family protein [Streptacidiphilus sp. ASG 303]|uniref:enoyl-CoA hydratase/isomerase family protein n=1 Tax=Streptacidiphilus sp. ASG 303 TaxID=2896847 RepID=UPI001E552B50|nr:enoyl-CoA hydratase/isomerase family protein [Streptacidiphilus sp. ASG 303]MCD0485486.1 enoyl-CoA hydratase/isomerase family protein [Streptacidiphilus sp. ASG 303]